MIETSLCYLERNQKLLMLYRNKKPNDLNQGKWIGIGGKLEASETHLEAMIREVKEETGYQITGQRYVGKVIFHSDIDPSECMHLYHSKSFSGSMKASDEGMLKWIEMKDIFSLNLWEGDPIFIKLMLENVAFFTLELFYVNHHLNQAILNGTLLKTF